MANTECWELPTDLIQGDPEDGAGGSDLNAADDNMLRGAAENGVQAALRALGVGIVPYPAATSGLITAGAARNINIAAGTAIIEVNPAINGALGFVPVKWNAQTNIIPTGMAGLADASTAYIVANVVIPSTYATGSTVNSDSRRDATVAFTAQASSTAPNGGLILGSVVLASGSVGTVTDLRSFARPVAINNLTTETAIASGDFFPFYDVSASAERKVTRDNMVAISATSTAKTSNYTATATDDAIHVDASGGAVTITLPAAATRTRPLYISRINSGANNVTIDGDGIEQINGATTYVLTTQWQSVVLIAHGNAWIVY